MIIPLRLHNQHIAQQHFQEPSEVIGWMGAIQAQDYPGAKWSIALRLPNATDAEIEQAIDNKTILRTWPMRGTLHFVRAADIRWILALTTPRIIAGSARRYRELELDEPVLERCAGLLAQALEGRQQLNRSQLMAVLESNGISTQGQRAPYILQYASSKGLIAQTTTQRSQPVYILLDEWLPPASALAREEALAELAKRYFTSRAPATLQDFAWWSGLTMADVRAGLEAVKAQFIEEIIDGQRYWLPASMPGLPPALPGTVYLLPGFDEYLLGYKDRSAVLHPQHANKVVPGGNGIFMNTIVLDGQVVGIWKRTIRKQAVSITPQPFTDHPLPDLSHPAGRYARFLNLAASLEP